MMGRIRNLLINKFFLIPALSLLLYSLLGFVIAPFAIRWYVPKYARDQLHCQATIEKVRLNPFIMSFEAVGFNLSGPKAATIIGFDRLFIDFEMMSLFRWTAMFREFRIEKPALHITFEPDGAINLTRLIPESTEKEANAARSESIGLILQSVAVVDGEVTITDSRESTPVVLAFHDLDLDLNALSTLRDQNGTYSLAARTADGEIIRWQGEIGLAPLRSSGKVEFSGIQAATLWEFMQHRVSLDAPSGKLDLRTDYRLDASRTPMQLLLENFRVDLSTLSLKLSGAEQSFFELKKLEIDCALFDFAARALQVNSLLLDGGMLQANIDEAGESNIQRVSHGKPRLQTNEATLDAKNTSVQHSSDAPPPWSVNVEAIEIKDFDLSLEDQSRIWPMTAGVTISSLHTKAKIEAGPSTKVWIRQLAADLKGARFGSKEIQRPIFEAQRLSIEGGDFDLDAKTLTVSRVELGNGHIGVERDKAGKSNIEQILSAKIRSRPEPGKRPLPGPEPEEAGLVRVVRKTPPEEAKEAPPPADGRPEADPSAADVPSWRVNLEAIEIKDIAFALEDLSPATPLLAAASSISINSTVKIEAGPKTELTLGGISIETKGVRAGSKEAPSALFEAQRLTIEGGELDLATRSVTVSRIGLSDGHLDLVREQDGAINLENLFASKGETSDVPGPGLVAVQSPPWKFLLKTFELTGFRSALSDYTFLPEKPLYNVQDLTMRVSDFDGGSSTGFEVSFGVEQGGKVGLRGKVDPTARSVEANIKVAGLVLNPLDPYLAPFITLTLQSAVISSEGTFRYGVPETGCKLAYEGSFDLDKLSLNQPGSGETYLGWGAMHIPQLKLALEPNNLRVGEIRLSKPVGQLIISEDKTVNLAKILKEQPTAIGSAAQSEVPPKDQPGVAAKKASVSSKTPPGKTEDSFPFTIGKVRIEEGNMVFADLSLRPKFMTRMHGLKGTVSRLSSSKNSVSEIQLDGRVDQYGSARINGTMDVSDYRRSTDLNMTFRNVEMASVTPYSGKFAGRKIESGKLSMDLQYRIEETRLVGDNKIIVDNLVLGEHVDSPDAVNLPLDLAIALLSDSKGRINIGLPVSGDLNDPRFSIGPLVWKALVTILTKAVTAPFRALGALFSGEADNLDTVEFDPGKMELLPPEREKLKKVADALQKRPQLKLMVQGHYSPEADGLQFKQISVRLAVTTGMGLKPGAKGDPGELDFSNSKVRRSLEKIYEERFGSAALDELDRAVKRGEIKPAVEEESDSNKKRKKPGGISGVLHSIKFYKVIPGAKSPEQSELMGTELYARLVESEPVSDEALKQLAMSRAQEITKELRNEWGVAADRLFTADAESRAEEAGLSTKLSLEALSAP